MSATEGRASGLRAERELARKLWSRGLAVVRGPASGAGARRLFYPDLVVMYRGFVAVLEVKARSRPEGITLTADRVSRLFEFARRAGARVFLAVKLRGAGWRFVELEEGLRGPDGAVRVSAEQLRRGLDLEAFTRLVKASGELGLPGQPGKLSSPSSGRE